MILPRIAPYYSSATEKVKVRGKDAPVVLFFNWAQRHGDILGEWR